MQFRFDPNQEYQTDAIESVADLFDGMPRAELDLNFTLGFAAVPNRLDLDEASLLANLRAVQDRRGIEPEHALACIDKKITDGGGERDVRFPNFSVEMETGTGKTYVYLRTVLELHRRYGLRKFIIVVPSIAIREGVLKTLKITDAHLRGLYGNVPYRYYVYDSANLSQVRQFALSNGVELMIMTIDSFNKASNLIRQSTDRLQGETPINLIQAARPILILDEPQNMESEQSVQALSALDPLFALRYSATHRNPYNLVYRLTPFDAYRQGLVKRIEVASVVTEDSIGQPFIRLDAIKTAKKSLTATLTVDKLMAKGAVKRTAMTVKPDDSLEAKTKRSEYAGYVVDEISKSDQLVRFKNDVEINEGESKGADREAVFAAQIQYTIEEHMRRQARLREQGIKVLSLFFIDKVDNYAAEDGVIRRIFDESFDAAKKAHAAYATAEPETVREAYFAKRRRRSGETEEIDTSGKSKEDEAAFDLIMKDKERLLSFDEPVSFIFSHSALREGWDNPNIFQICTLNQTVSEMKKRQEVGRGIRLAVNQDGERVPDEQINVLTVVANESYERYVGQLQREIEAEYGVDGVPPKPANARKRKAATLRKGYMLKPEFKELWERIKHKTRYAVKIDTQALLGDAMPEIDAAQIKPPRVTITKAMVRLDDADAFEPLRMSGAKTMIDLAGRYPLPNLVDLMANLMEHTTPPVRLTRATLLEVYTRTTNKQAAIDNPQEFASVAVRVLKAKLADHLVNGIEYTKIGEWYEMGLWEENRTGWEPYFIPADKSLYDAVIIDTHAADPTTSVEGKFVAGLEKDDRVKLYVKLPGWFQVDTPVGTYNPDWAIVMEERDAHDEVTDTLYLVRETKGTNLEALRPDERRKIRCGERHFEGALGVSYRVVSSANDLP